MKILVTGATGFLGNELCKLISIQYKLHALVRNESDITKISKYIPLEYIHIYNTHNNINDIINYIKPDIIIHAACVYDIPSMSIDDILESNVEYGSLLLEALSTLNKKVVFYNINTSLPQNINRYSLSKHLFAKMGKYYASRYSIQFINVRMHLIYGYAGKEDRFPLNIIRSCINNSEYIDLTEGSQVRDFIFIDDAVDALLKLISKYKTVSKYKNIEVGSGVPVTVKHFVNKIHELTKSKSLLRFGSLPIRLGEPRRILSDNIALKDIGWTPKYSLHEGLLKTINQLK